VTPTFQVGICLAWGGAGDPPAPPGDPPGGMAVLCGCEKTVAFRSMPLPIPSGGSPDGTGGSPVLPTLNPYALKRRAIIIRPSGTTGRRSRAQRLRCIGNEYENNVGETFMNRIRETSNGVREK